jgi:hypothetical protein
MKGFVFLILGFACLGLIFLSPYFLFIKFTSNYIFSSFSILLNYCLIIICITHIIFNYFYAEKLVLPINQIILLPSTLIPLLMTLLYSFPILLSLTDKSFKIDLVNINYLDTTIELIVFSCILFLIGIIVGKNQILFNKKIYLLKSKRTLDFYNYKHIKIYIFVLVILAIAIFPFNLGLRIDVLLEGGRGFYVNSNILLILIPLAGILSTIFTILAGFLYSKSGNISTFWVPAIDILPRAVALSRGFFLPLIFFIFSSSLLGHKFPKWLYFSIIPLSIISSAVALTARGLSLGGVTGLIAGFSQNEIDPLSSIKVFYESNTNIGIVSQAVAFHDHSKSFLDGLLVWLTTISPTPNAVGNALQNIPSVAELLGIKSVGIPMPVVGELYFQMGWLGLLIFFFLGLWAGRLEGNIILHTKIYGSAYWPHVLIWMSILYGFILSFHSASRGSSRVLFYSVAFIWLLELLDSFKTTYQK